MKTVLNLWRVKQNPESLETSHRTHIGGIKPGADQGSLISFPATTLTCPCGNGLLICKERLNLMQCDRNSVLQTMVKMFCCFYRACVC